MARREIDIIAASGHEVDETWMQAADSGGEPDQYRPLQEGGGHAVFLLPHRDLERGALTEPRQADT